MSAAVIKRGEREICKRTPAGLREYRHRRVEMWNRDSGLCCLCFRPVTMEECSFEHIHGRGMGGSKRDDRIEHNGVSHYFGNMARGSIRYEKYMELSLEQRIHNCSGGYYGNP